MHINNAAMNTIAMASMNGPEIRSGKNARPVTVCACAWLSPASTCGPRSLATGL